MSKQAPQPLEDFEEIRRYIRGAIRRACPRWDPDDVEETTQRAMVRLMEMAQKAPDEKRFTRPYLSRVVYTHIVDEIRRRRPLTPFEVHEKASGGLPAPGSDPEGDCSLSELKQAIWGCLERLNGNRRHAVILTLLGYKNREIAKLMGWDAKQAENHVTRGRADLRSCLNAKGYRG